VWHCAQSGRACSQLAITWTAGYNAVEETHSPDTFDTIHLSGFGARAGAPPFREAQVAIPIATFAEHLGISERAVREYILHAL